MGTKVATESSDSKSCKYLHQAFIQMTNMQQGTLESWKSCCKDFNQDAEACPAEYYTNCADEKDDYDAAEEEEKRDYKDDLDECCETHSWDDASCPSGPSDDIDSAGGWRP